VTVVVVTLVLSVILCGIYLRFARTRNLLDAPTERSSHSSPTPHGGGAALLSAFTLGILLAVQIYGAWDDSFVALVVAALLLMGLGLIDDLRGLSVRSRLVVYGVICLLVAVILLQDVLTAHAALGIPLVLLAALALLWLINLYNFMDGIDGIAALQALLTCCGAATLVWLTGRDSEYVLFCLLLAAAHGGFLVWNYPPARLFMGDAGSVPTGFLLAGLAILGAAQGQLNPLCWLVLLAVFITDATWTLLWRMATGQAFTQPHRLHAYQRLSRYWGSHLGVDRLLLAINILWLFPLALAIVKWPELGLFLVFLAYLPLLFGMAKMSGLS
jgi:Fuc2NAc and GlcNAc transferase